MKNREGMATLGASALRIFLIALVLRLPVVLWELPGPLHNFSYHPDELPILAAAANVDVTVGDLNPEFYNYGTLHVYAVSALYRLAGGVGMGLDGLTLVSRLMVAVLGAATAAVCCAMLYRRSAVAGWAAGLFVAAAPLHAQQSGFMTVDVPATFWVALAAWAVMSERYAWAGAAAGLAAATKYTAGSVLVAPLASLVLARPRRWYLWALAAVAAAAVAFVAGCPGALLYRKDFLAGLGFEAQHARMGHGLVFEGTGNGAVYHLLHSLLPGLGWPMLVLAVAGLGYLIARGSWQERSLAAFAVAYFALVSTAEVRFARYMLPLVPVFAVGVGRLIGDGGRRARKIGLVCLGATLPYTLLLVGRGLVTDPRTAAAQWIRSNVPSGSTISVPTVPWFYSPPLSPRFGELAQMGRIGAAKAVEGYQMIVPTQDWAVWVLGENPDVVIISSFEEQDRKRLGDSDYRAFTAELDRKYRLSARFAAGGAYRAWSIVELPHDMSYLSPEIRIYEPAGK